MCQKLAVLQFLKEEEQAEARRAVAWMYRLHDAKAVDHKIRQLRKSDIADIMWQYEDHWRQM